MTIVFSFAMSGQLQCTFKFILLDSGIFTQELTLCTSICEGVDRICTQKLDQENFLEISPSLRVFTAQDFSFVDADLRYNKLSITTPHNLALDKVNRSLWNYYGGFDYYYKA